MPFPHLRYRAQEDGTESRGNTPS
eukprot:COSAG06_NODE_47710_length_337_cov_0.869748_1_plen_23_part_10